MEPTEPNKNTDSAVAPSATEQSPNTAIPGDKAKPQAAATKPSAKPDSSNKPGKPPKPGATARPKSAGGGRWLVWLALLIALLALGFSLWQWQQRHAHGSRSQMAMNCIMQSGEDA